MGISIVFGESGNDLKKAFINQIIEHKNKYPQKRAILIVPETVKMDMEYEYLINSDEAGMMNTEVLSFSRFCYRILGEAGKVFDNLIDDSGKSMIIFRVLKENENEWISFRNLAQKPGFISEILSIMGDFKRLLISGDDLFEVSKQIDDKILSQKASELSIILSQYDKLLKESLLRDPQENYTLATNLIKTLVQQRRSGGLKWPYSNLEWLFDAKVWINGFGETRDFTPQEYNIITNLKDCCDITVSCVFDDLKSSNNTNPYARALYRAGLGMIESFYSKGLISDDYLPLKIDNNRNHVFEHLANCWKNQNAIIYSKLDSKLYIEIKDLIENKANIENNYENIALIHSSNKREEISLIAGEINRLVRDENYRYKDIAVIAAGVDSYIPVVHAIFGDCAIPYYIAEKKSLKDTVLIRMIKNLLDLQVFTWSHKSLMSYLRCGLSDAKNTEIDEFETFLLSSGIKWKGQFFDDKKFKKIEKSSDSDTIHSEGSLQNVDKMIGIRDRISKNITVFEMMCKNAKNCDDFCIALKSFLENEKIYDKIEFLSENLIQSGEENAAIGIVKAWNELLSLLNQMQLLAKTSTVDVKTFRDLLLSGMEISYAGTIPSLIDQVNFVPVKQGINKSVKVVFVIGLTKDAYPEKVTSEGLLKDHEREQFSKHFNIKIPSIITDKYYEDLFLSYTILGLAKERLYLSCPQTDDDEQCKKLIESDIITFTRNCFPKCRKIQINPVPSPFDLNIYSKQNSFLNLLAYNPSENKIESKSFANKKIEWTALYEWLNKTDEYKSKIRAVEDKLACDKSNKPLSKENIATRYGENITMSVSQLETYSACSYSHFAKYLLKLQERDVYTLKSSDTGSLMHGITELAIKEFLEEYNSAPTNDEKAGVILKYKNMNFEIISKEKMLETINRDMMHTFLEPGFNSSKGRTSYRMAASTLKGVFADFEYDGFLPQTLEWEFSKENGNALTLDLSENKKILFQGKVDRIDTKNEYFRVIDYKSGNKIVDFEKWYHALSLQLPAYIAAYRQTHPEMMPSNAAYIRFARPVISYDNGNIETIASEHSKKLASENKMKGTELSPEDLIEASKYTVEMMKKLSNDLVSGKVSLNPKKVINGSLPCEYCEYGQVCGFEERYNDVVPLKKLEVKDVNGNKIKKYQSYMNAITKK